MLKLTPLKSSSSGNLFILSDGHISFMLDCGLSLSEFEQGLKFHPDIDPFKIKGMLITHKHGDHTKGMKAISEKYHIKIFMSKGTASDLSWDGHYKEISAFKPFKWKEWTITPIDVEHSNSQGGNCNEPLNFVIENGEAEKVAYITDTGTMKYKLENYQMYIIEANYATIDYALIKGKGYAQRKQERAMQDDGHMSLEYACNYLNNNIGNKTRKIIMMHLSVAGSDLEY